MIDIDDAVDEGVATSAMKAKLIELEAEKEALSAKMAAFAQADNVVVLHLAAVDAYHKEVAESQAALTADEQKRREDMDIVRAKPEEAILYMERKPEIVKSIPSFPDIIKSL